MMENNKISNGMKIGIDCRLWGQAGVGRYVRNLVFNLLKIDESNVYVLFIRREEVEIVQNQIAKFKIQNSKFKIIPVKIPWHSIKEQLLFSKLIDKEKVDLMHFPYFSVPLFYNKPFVVTIHDLIYHHFVSGEASTLPLWLYGFKMISYRLIIKHAAGSARKIIAVSQFTKRDIMNNLGIKEEKIEVISEAADDFNRLSVQSFQGVPLQDYFLYVGNVYRHKNPGALIEAFKILHKENPKLKLVFVGKEDFFYKNLKKKFSKLINQKSIIFKDNISDQELASLYKNAICLVRPSLMEGFSLPPLEAMSAKGIVLASDIPVHREIFDDAVIYFDTYKIDDLISKMKFLLNIEREEKNKIIKKGIEKTKEYSWRITAEQTLKVYESSL